MDYKYERKEIYPPQLVNDTVVTYSPIQNSSLNKYTSIIYGYLDNNDIPKTYVNFYFISRWHLHLPHIPPNNFLLSSFLHVYPNDFATFTTLYYWDVFFHEVPAKHTHTKKK